jgi:hypothetical protein
MGGRENPVFHPLRRPVVRTMMVNPAPAPKLPPLPGSPHIRSAKGVAKRRQVQSSLLQPAESVSMVLTLDTPASVAISKAPWTPRLAFRMMVGYVVSKLGSIALTFLLSRWLHFSRHFCGGANSRQALIFRNMRRNATRCVARPHNKPHCRTERICAGNTGKIQSRNRRLEVGG